MYYNYETKEYLTFSEEYRELEAVIQEIGTEYETNGEGLLSSFYVFDLTSEEVEQIRSVEKRIRL